MQIPIGKVIEAAHVSGLSKVRAINILKSSEHYRNCVIGNGNTVDGDKDELARYLRQVFYEENSEKNDEVPEPLNNNQRLRNEIEKLKQELPSGSSYYEYKTIIIQDSPILGTTDADNIELTLIRYALKGWRLKAAISSEVGHNKAVVVNATINNTILILERLTTKE